GPRPEIRGGIKGRKAFCDGGELGIGLVQRGAGPEQPHHREVVAAAVRVRGTLEWSEEVLRRAEAEVGREDTDDRVGAAVEPDTPAERQGIAGEAIAPEPVRE